jgi:tetratricopeptide (TPR) repeat protein
MADPLGLVLVGSFGNSGDQIYRLHQPAAALGQLEGVEVHEIHANARPRDAAALAADVLVLLMGMDVELLRLAHQRRLLGRPTVLEVNDWLPGVQHCNPVYANWSDSRAWELLTRLMAQCDAVQVSSRGLAKRLAPLGHPLQVLDNQLSQVPPLQPRPPGGRVRIGWGGSAGHLDDLAAIAPALVAWLWRQDNVRLELMADPIYEGLFAAAPPDRFRLHQPGSLDHYLQWLEGLHIGLGPLLPTEYNACRSDVKYLEYASRGVVPVMQRGPTYAAVRDGETGLLFSDDDELLALLDGLVADPDRGQRLADAAHRHVRDQRLLEQHVPRQLSFYRQLLERSPAPATRSSALGAPPPAPPPPALLQAAVMPLAALRHQPGWQQRGPRHWYRDLAGTAEQQLQAGLEAIQRNRWPQALEHFRQSTAADPADPYALVFLGQALERLDRPHLAQQAYERAASLDPLGSRPLRALATLHQRNADRWAAAAAALNPETPLPTSKPPPP